MALRAFLTLVLLTSTMAAEDWPTFRHDLRRTNHTAEQLPATKLREVWSQRTAHPPRTAWTAPARWDAYAYVRGLKSMRDYDIAFQPIVANGLVYYGSSVDDSIHCLNLKTGKQQWIFTTDGPLRNAPTFANGRLYFGSDDGHAYCLTTDGKLVWKYRPKQDEPRIMHNGRLIGMWPCRTGVVVDKGVAYCGFSMLPWRESILCGLNIKTGLPEGKGCFERKLSKGHTIEGSIALTSDQIIITQGRISPAIFRRSDGASQGALKGGGGSLLAMPTNKSTIHGPGNKEGWLTVSAMGAKKPIATYKGRLSVAIAPRLTVMMGERTIAAVSDRQKKFVWESSTPNPQTLMIAGSHIYVGGVNQVRAYQLTDGRLIWAAKVDGRAHGLVVAHGSLLASTDQGTIHCFAPGAEEVKLPKEDKPVVESKPTVPIKAAADPDLISQWIFHNGMSAWAKRRGLPNSGQRVRDLKGRAHGTVTGTVQMRPVGSVEAIELQGKQTIQLAADHRRATLPKRDITVEAWVRVDKPLQWGGILGAIQDNGSYEHGWLLGYTNKQFSFGLVSTKGPGKLTYLKSETEFVPGQWYHVVGTFNGTHQKVFVNGKQTAVSTVQKGDISYPKKALFEMGAYHDDDEFFPMTGLLHEVRLYRRALSGKEIESHYRGAMRKFPQAIQLAMGPYVTFTAPDKAMVRWHTDKPEPSTVTYGLQTLNNRAHNEKLTTKHAVEITGLGAKQIVSYQIHTGDGITPRFEMDTHFNYTLPEMDSTRNPYRDNQSEKTAEQILRMAKIKKGICLVMGCADGSLAYAMAQQSEMQIIIVDSDAERIAKARAKLLQSGIYGWRVSAHYVKDMSSLPFTGCFANLIISEQIRGSATELYRVLRPTGGMALLGADAQAWLTKAKVKFDVQGAWVKVVRSALPGAGSWSHLYGQADNSAFGGETLGNAKSVTDLRVQWLGRPGPRAQPDRSGRKPSPLSTHGRLFVQGLHRLIGVDAFNGTLLWELEIPPLERFNMPRDCGNWCADDQFVYAAIGSHCWQIDAQTGQVVKFHDVTPGDLKQWKYDWSFIARSGNKLIGSAVKKGTAYTNFWGNANQGWYDAVKGPATFKVCSENLFARDSKTGKQSWTYTNGLILNATVTIAKDRIYFVECRSTSVKGSNNRRVGMPQLWEDQYLVALDVNSGKKIYEKPLKVRPGIVVFYMAHGNGKLVLASSANGRYDVYARQASDGKELWQQDLRWYKNKGDHGKAMSRPAVVNHRVYVRPGVMDLATGKLLPMQMPAGGCGTYAATTNLFVYRNSNITIWNPAAGKATSWNRLRPGCWLSTIPAGGMILSPEAGGGCSCGSWLEASMGFIPKQAAQR